MSYTMKVNGSRARGRYIHARAWNNTRRHRLTEQHRPYTIRLSRDAWYRLLVHAACENIVAIWDKQIVYPHLTFD